MDKESVEKTLLNFSNFLCEISGDVEEIKNQLKNPGPIQVTNSVGYVYSAKNKLPPKDKKEILIKPSCNSENKWYEVRWSNHYEAWESNLSTFEEEEIELWMYIPPMEITNKDG